MLYKLGTCDTIRFKEILGISHGRMGFKKQSLQNGRTVGAAGTFICDSLITPFRSDFCSLYAPPTEGGDKQMKGKTYN